MDKFYWNQFYEKKKGITESSDFAKFIMEYFQEKKFFILDVGCGNGRDSYYLARRHNVVGCDLSSKPENKRHCLFVEDDMVKIDKKPYDLIYSRFSLHSITDDNQREFLESISKGTILCIETRSKLGENSYRVFGDTHYRNLTDIVFLRSILRENKFTILYEYEGFDVAKYKDENPICIRMICKKE